MLAYIRQKKKSKAVEEGKPGKLKVYGAFGPSNRDIFSASRVPRGCAPQSLRDQTRLSMGWSEPLQRLRKGMVPSAELPNRQYRGKLQVEYRRYVKLAPKRFKR